MADWWCLGLDICWNDGRTVSLSLCGRIYTEYTHIYIDSTLTFQHKSMAKLPFVANLSALIKHPPHTSLQYMPETCTLLTSHNKNIRSKNFLYLLLHGLVRQKHWIKHGSWLAAHRNSLSGISLNWNLLWNTVQVPPMWYSTSAKLKLFDPGQPGGRRNPSGAHSTVVSDCRMDWAREWRWDCAMCSKPFLEVKVLLKCRSLLRRQFRHILLHFLFSSPWTWTNMKTLFPGEVL